MSAVAGYKTQLKVGGTATAFSDEPLIGYGNSLFRVDDPLKRVISPNHEISIIDTITLDAIPYEKVNYLEGFVLLNVGIYTGPFQISAYYIPLTFIGGTKDYTLDIAGDILDSSAFHTDDAISEGFREKVHGLSDVSLSFGRYSDVNNFIKNAKINKTPIYVSINPGASKTFIAGWFVIETDSISGDIGALEEESVSLMLNGTLTNSFSYMFDYTESEASVLTEEEMLANYFIS